MSRGSFARWTAAALAVLIVVATGDAAQACPMCKAALASGEGGGDLVSGFFYSILFMLSMPFAILGVFSGLMYREVRRARASEARKPASPPESPGEAGFKPRN